MTPAFGLAFSMMLLVMSVVSVGALLGLIPDRVGYQLEARARVAEALTLQLAMAASRNDVEIIRSTISAVQKRDDEINSIALKNSAGEFLAVTPDHNEFWAGANPDRSTQTHVHIPITNGAENWGTVEIVFTPLAEGLALFGIPHDLLLFSGFIGGSSFLGMFIILRRSLRQLDPTRSVPSRVQSAFDSLSDGIAVIDEKDTILLVNQSLAAILGSDQGTFVGRNLSALLWRQLKRENQLAELPWLTALRENKTVRDVAMNLRTESGDIVNLLVNATSISSDGKIVNGALVTFKDVTVLERKNRDLSLAYNKLQQSETEIKKQNNQLKYLANHDPLTTCFNRRALFEQFEEKYLSALSSGKPLTCLMIDIDHFKSVNDTYGHAVGDDVIAGLARTLLDASGPDDIVGRYGGEEFCMALDGSNLEAAVDLAESLRRRVKELSPGWLKQDRTLSISVGIARVDEQSGSVNGAVNNADQALYTAKKTGRDRAVVWNPDAQSPVASITDGQAPISNEERTGHGTEAVPRGKATIQVFIERLKEYMKKKKKKNTAVAVICVNLDSQDECQKLYGPRVSAEVLQNAHDSLNAIFRDADMVSLMSGKERSVSLVSVSESRFLIELTQINDSTSVYWVLQRLVEKLSSLLDSAIGGPPVRFSVGACLYPNDGDQAGILIENAIAAQRMACEQHGDKAFQIFSADMEAMADEQYRLEKGIREAIAEDEFHLYFQPIVNLETGEVSGAEVLLRSSNEYLKNTSIDAVIQVAERTGLIHEVSECVFRTAFSIVNEWLGDGVALPLISINVSAEQLKSHDLIYNILSLVEAQGVNPASIQLEMTESAMVTDIGQASEILGMLQTFGFHIALDDFGTGQSSLSHLLQINPDTIKIDKSFVQSLETSQANQILVSTIVELSRKIGAKVIAEGVETPEQLEMLAGMGCHYIQGYLLSKPLPAHLFIDWLQLFRVERAKVEGAISDIPLRAVSE